jgi:polysaccharide export outer membrane protein
MGRSFISAMLLPIASRTGRARFLVLSVMGLFCGMAGCSTPQFREADLDQKPDPIVVREGDVLRVTFPGTPNLNATQQVRRDGKITLSLVGDVAAAGKTRLDLEKDLKELYASQLVTKDVTVTIESSTYEIYVTGAVLRPGKVITNRQLTALEAIMEAGGPDYTKANLKSVQVIRNNKDHVDHYKLDLKRVLKGADVEPFKLKPSDIIYVPERFSWF